MQRVLLALSEGSSLEFLHRSTIAMLGWIVLCCGGDENGGCSVHCRIFNDILTAAH